MNCESLESIQIGYKSFNDFGGEFELKNLSQLQSIQIGFDNFYYNSFVIRGIDMIFNIWMIDLPNLQSITLDSDAFYQSLSTIIESMEFMRMKWFE